LAINQAYLFLVFALNGIFIGILFDFFRILRKSFKTVNFITNIEDILFWILTGLSIIYCMYNFSGGALRFFMLLGLILGILLYMLTLSDFLVKIVVKIISIIKKIQNNMTKKLKNAFNNINKSKKVQKTWVTRGILSLNGE